MSSKKSSANPRADPSTTDRSSRPQTENDALNGKVDTDYPVTAKTVRIFTSSTFTDTKVERNALMERVYPRLKEFCQGLGYEFQVVDMRWGVRDEATDDHMTSQLCMKEIKDCQKYSTGPNFITFLAQKYGYRPFPPVIEAEEFETMMDSIESNEDRDILKEWFLLDENAVPSAYKLQPIRDKLPHYADNSNPDEKKKARGDWWTAFERMQIILRQAASKALKKHDAVHKYFWSVTEEEIYNGIIHSSKPDIECFWFKRHIRDLNDHIDQKMAARFMDIAGGSIDQEALDLLTKLKDVQIPKKLPTKNIIKYDVGWTENAIDPDKSTEHKDYLERFLQDFKKILKQMIEKGIASKAGNAITDTIALECIEHLKFAQSKISGFHGHEKFLSEVKDFVTENGKGKPLVILGEPGSGKTTFLAKLAAELPSWMGTETPAIIRFIGTTPKSSSTRELMASVIEQKIKLFGEDAEVPTDMKELKTAFQEFLKSCSMPLIVVLDSLDQLRDGATQFRIPANISDEVTLVLSTIPGETYEIEPQLRSVLTDECFKEIPQFTSQEIHNVITKALEAGGRTLQDSQLTVLKSACEGCVLPLYIKIAVDEAKRWKSHTAVSADALGASIHLLINDLFARVEKYHGAVLVSHALGYVTAAKAGLSSAEIEDVLSCDDIVLKDVLQYHQPPQRRLPPLLWVRIHADISEYLVTGGADGIQVYRWYHRHFRQVAEERYLKDEEHRKFIHLSLAEYFMGKWGNGAKKSYVDHKTGKPSEADRFVSKQPYVFSKGNYNLRKLNELPFHLVKAQEPDQLKELTLCNFEFLFEKLRANGIDSVQDDFDLAKAEGLADEDIQAVSRCLQQSRDGLMMDPLHLAVQIVGRLSGGNGEGAVGKLVTVARQPHVDCYVTNQEYLRACGNALVKKYLVGGTQIMSLAVNEASTEIAAFSGSILHIYDLEDGSETQAIEFGPENIGDPEVAMIMANTLKFYDNDTKILVISLGRIHVIDRKKEAGIQSIELPASDNHMSPSCLHFIPQKKILVVMNDAPEIAWFNFPGNGKKIDSIKVEHNKEILYTQKSFMDGLGEEIVYHRAGSNKLHMFNFANYTKTHKEFVLFPDKVKSKMVARVALTSGGLVGVYIYEPPDSTQDVVPKLEDCKASVKVYDLKQKVPAGVICDIPGGWFLGMETLLALDETNVILNSYQGFEIFYQKFDLKNCTFSVSLKISTMLTMMVKTAANHVIGPSMTDQLVLEQYDLSAGESPVSSASEPDWYEEGNKILGMVPGSRRFVALSTLSEGWCIWDTATQTIVRSISQKGYGSTAQWMDKDHIVFANESLKGLVAVDVNTMKIKHNLPGVFADSNDPPYMFGMLQDGVALLVGPESNQVSFIKLSTGKSLAKLTMDKDVELGGLLVSANKETAIVSTRQFVPGRAANVPPTDGISKLYVIDLKTKKKLPDVVCRGCKLAMYVSAAGSAVNQAALTRDGKIYLSIKHTDKEQEVWFWNTRTGKGEQIPQVVGQFVNLVQISEPLKCFVLYIFGRKLILWNYERKKEMKAIPIDPNASLARVSISEDGLKMAMMYKLTLIRVLDLQTGTFIGDVFPGNTILELGMPGSGNFLFVTMRAVKATVQFYMHKVDGKTMSLEEACKQMLKEKDRFGKLKIMNK